MRFLRIWRQKRKKKKILIAFSLYLSLFFWLHLATRFPASSKYSMIGFQCSVLPCNEGMNTPGNKGAQFVPVFPVKMCFPRDCAGGSHWSTCTETSILLLFGGCWHARCWSPRGWCASHRCSWECGAASKEQGPALIKCTTYFKRTECAKLLREISISRWCNTVYFNVNLLSYWVCGRDQDWVESDCQ